MNNEGRRESYYRPLSAFCEHMKKNNGYRFFVASMYDLTLHSWLCKNDSKYISITKLEA